MSTLKDVFQKINFLTKKDRGILSVLLFGSFLKSKKYNDIDIMIVKRQVPLNPVSFSKSYLEIKKLIDIPKVDLKIISRKQFLENLKNHNPFYLDIAFDSDILYDPSGLFRKNFSQTQKYVKDKGIIRDKKHKGWDFPVKYRRPTPLSRLTNQDRTQIWFRDALREYQTAGLLIKKFPEKSVIHSQQAIEKVVKSVLICFGKFKGVHYVGEILKKSIKTIKLTKEWQNKLNKLADFSIQIEPEFIKSRYPEAFWDGEKKIWIPMNEYTIDDAKYFWQMVNQALKITEGFLKWWFK